MAASTPRPPQGSPSPRPRRPRPSRATIIRRRIVALLILLALLALIAFGITRLVQAIGGALASDPDPTPTVTATPEPQACAPQTLTLTTRAQGFMVGESGEVVATIATTADEPCLVQTGRDALEFTVTSGTDTVWDASTCRATPADRPLLLDAGSSTELVLTWDGTRSDAECGPDRPVAEPGTYRYNVTLDSTLSDFSTVVVEPDPEATPTGEDGTEPADGATDPSAPTDPSGAATPSAEATPSATPSQGAQGPTTSPSAEVSGRG